MTDTTFSKSDENRVRRRAERQGYMLVKSRRLDPHARGYGTYALVADNRPSVYDPRDRGLVEAAQREMDLGNGLTLAEVERKLGYGSET